MMVEAVLSAGLVAVTTPDCFAVWVAICLTLAFMFAFLVRQSGNDDHPPVNRGRRVVDAEQARTTARSKLRH